MATKTREVKLSDAEPTAQLPAPPAGTSAPCPNCGMPIGEYTQVGSEVWLRIGTVLLKFGHGVCMACGHSWHWAVTQVSLAKLIERSRQTERGTGH